MSDDEIKKNFDSFFLGHLQSIKGNGAWYRNQHFIGKGGNGTTFFVTCTSGENTGLQFALKVFHKISDDQRRQRFLEEVRHYRGISHPAIIKVYDEGTFKAHDREYPFAVVDYIPANLEIRLGYGAPQIPRLDVIRYVFNIAAGISYLHSQTNPIVHRDIKPANILVSGKIARLGDLGLAKVLMSNDAGEDTNDVSSYVAMPRFYRTPELVRIAKGEKVVLTAASDIYQLGLVLYRAVTGYNAQKPPKNNILEEIDLDIRPIQGIAGNRLNHLIGQMLKDDPGHRPKVGAVLIDLGMIHDEVCAAEFEATGVMR